MKRRRKTIFMEIRPIRYFGHFFTYILGWLLNVGIVSSQDSIPCLTIAENDCNQPVFSSQENACEGWICWESQLTLQNKVFITNTINKFRNSWAQNVTNMNKLVWHWSLEQEAIKAAKTCDRKYLEHYDEPRNIHGLGYSLTCENGCIYKRNMLAPSQNQFKALLLNFLSENELHDFNENYQFRRGNALFFGCALVIIRTVVSNTYQNIFNFICVFCTRESSIYSVQKSQNPTAKCPTDTTRGEDPDLPLLCVAKDLETIYACEPENPCPDYQRTEVWAHEFEGIVAKLAVVNTNMGPVILVNESITQIHVEEEGTSVSQTTSTMYPDISGQYAVLFGMYPPVPPSIYFYSEKRAKTYNDSLHSLLSPTRHYAQPELDGECEVVIPEAAVEGSTDAPCCVYLFVGSLITTVLLIFFICYTIQDYKKLL